MLLRKYRCVVNEGKNYGTRDLGISVMRIDKRLVRKLAKRVGLELKKD
ncbi:MAG: hypothetical protein ACE5ES_02580 [Candidatus Nanoarchaeia archaeon]